MCFSAGHLEPLFTRQLQPCLATHSLQSYLGSFSAFTFNISHPAPFEVSATRYAIKGVLHLYLMSLPAKGVSLSRR